MKFSTKEDVEIPIENCFRMLSDFEFFETAALRRGADVVRTDANAQPDVGASWDVRASFRGKPRNFKLEVSEYDVPNSMKFDAKSGGMLAHFLIELVALSRNRTRMRIELDVKPKTLSARLLIQSAKLARNRLNRRFKNRVAHFAEDIEDRYKRSSRS